MTEYPYYFVEGRRFPAEEHRLAVYSARRNGKIVERRDQAVSILIKTRCPEKWVMVDTETGEMWRFEDGVGFSRISLQEVEGVAALAASVLKSNGATNRRKTKRS